MGIHLPFSQRPRIHSGGEEKIYKGIIYIEYEIYIFMENMQKIINSVLKINNFIISAFLVTLLTPFLTVSQDLFLSQRTQTVRSKKLFYCVLKYIFWWNTQNILSILRIQTVRSKKLFKCALRSALFEYTEFIEYIENSEKRNFFALRCTFLELFVLIHKWWWLVDMMSDRSVSIQKFGTSTFLGIEPLSFWVRPLTVVT